MCYLSPYTGASIANEASKMKGCLWHYSNSCINGKWLDNDWTARINNNDICGQGGFLCDRSFFYYNYLLIFLGFESKKCFEHDKGHTSRNSFACLFLSCCQLSSLVGISIFDQGLRFISKVLCCLILKSLA